MFTNTVGPLGRRCIAAVAAMRELWEACFFVLILDFTFGKDITQNSSYVIRKIEACPDVGYFFKQDLSPNLVAPGPCYLCFCKENETAVCWERERRRCDVEKYHHHRVGRQTRYRRSFSDVFFRDATRDFFGKNLAQQCKPYESSFSEGCPPADWCVGCTICDCDSNGRWDCHILSFCDGKESKKKIKVLKNNKKKKVRKGVNYDNLIEVRKTTKIKPTPKTTKKKTTKPTKRTKPQKKNIKKVTKAKPNNKPSTRSNKSSKKSATKQEVPKRYPRRRPSKPISRNNPKTNLSKQKIIKKVVATRKPVNLNGNDIKGLTLNMNNSESVKLGEKIVKQVMTTFKKMLAREMAKLNETQRTRVLDGKDCGEVKKRDKRTYNVKSNAVARNKNKYNRQAIYQENYTNTRMKREILSEPEKVENISVITLPTDLNAVIPLDTSKEKSTFLTTFPHNVTKIPFSTLHSDKYYQHSIKNDSILSSLITSSTEPSKNTKMNTENDIQNNFVISDEPQNGVNDIKNNDTKIINPDFNDLKFSNWYIVKIKNDEEKKTVTSLLLPKSTSKSFYGKHVDSTYYMVPKFQKKQSQTKYNATMLYNLTTRIPKVHSIACCTKTLITGNKSDVTGLKSILQNLYTELNKTNKAKRKQKPKVSVLKYVRKFFHKLFSNKRTGSHKVYGLGTKEDHTLQILCENIGPCKLKKNNIMILKYKLKQLNNETKIVLKSIRTVKGLLHLLELPDNDITVGTKNNSFQNDVQKLGTVLRDYKDDVMNSSLTFDQKRQIDYIKKNTQVFIESVKKFADILTEIMYIIKPKDDIDQPLKSPSKSINHTSSLSKIKRILNQYNIMQNSFMKKIYELINREEKTVPTTEKAQISQNFGNQNIKDEVIDKYSKNIIKNLKKLKNIAQALSSKRTKREVMVKDDALEYLLTLMEILIKQNHPLAIAPASDGIDLLIDAIKSAPDIVPIKNNNLKYAPFIPASKQADITETSDIQAIDGSSESKRISNEENTTDFVIKPEIHTIRAIDDDDVTQKVYYRVYNQPNDSEDETTTEYNSITKKRSNDDQEKVGFDKFESYLGDPKKLEAEMVDLEDDVGGDVAIDSKARVNTTEVTHQDIKARIKNKSDTTKKLSTYISPSNGSSSESQQELINDTRPKIEWVDQAFDREIRIMNMSTSITTPIHKLTTQTTITTKKIKAKNMENISDITKEDHTEYSIKNTEEKSTNDVLYEKQMQFLQSLDYGTEKSTDFEEPESKEDSRSADSFQNNYFV